MPEIRPGAIIGRAFQIYRDQAGTVLGAALIVFAIQFLLALLLPKLLFIAGLAAFILSVFYGGMVVNLVRDVQDGRRDHSMGSCSARSRPCSFRSSVSRSSPGSASRSGSSCSSSPA